MKCDMCPIKASSDMCEGEISKFICDGITAGDERFVKLAKPVSTNTNDQPLTPPSTFEKIMTFGTAFADFIQNGMPMVPPMERGNRMRICMDCEFRGEDDQFHTQEGKCLKCGCFLAIKTWWATEECPIYKWPRLINPKPEHVQQQTLPHNSTVSIPSGGCGGCGK